MKYISFARLYFKLLSCTAMKHFILPVTRIRNNFSWLQNVGCMSLLV